jgi:hypothetical protein
MKNHSKLLFLSTYSNYYYFFDPNGGNVAERNSKSMQFFFLEKYIKNVFINGH